MKYLYAILLLSFIIVDISAQQNLTNFVDPFIGTSAHGHTFPGATVPFGMVQLSPDTGIRDWDWCSGYHSSDSSIIGFSHTHLSGTGCADYGDILLMPVSGSVKLFPGTKENPDTGYRSRFNHLSESAHPGYYSVLLSDYSIKAELTATTRVGFHKYTFNTKDSRSILLDIKHGISDQVIESYIKVLDETHIEGLRRSKGWSENQYVYFTMELSQPIKDVKLVSDNNYIESDSYAEGNNIKAVLKFNTDSENVILVKVAISSVSTEGAWNNLRTELPGWDFEKVRSNAETLWNNELNKIVVEGNGTSIKTVFYTALYHAMIAPNIYMDVDRKYRGMDNKIHTAEDHDHYTLFSLWDTFRATHPLFTIIDKKRTNDYIKSMYYKYVHSGHLPVWELSSNETWTMIGYHSVPVIVDAFMKGIRDYDIEKIYNALKANSLQDLHGVKFLKEMGYIPMDKENDAASKTLEYSYDDWCIARMAKELGYSDDYITYINRAMNYRNLFDTTTGFIRGRNFNGTWKKNFDPSDAHPLGAGEFTEGSSWQYTWFAPQDINRLINLIGGDDAFDKKLDQLFSASLSEGASLPSDVTGLIGQYAQGNEPSHHIPYLYNFVGKPNKTAEKVRQIMSELYHTGRDGLCGNEDCGQMSSWYLFSAIGFYPVTPGSNEYIIGSPIFDNVTVNLENGKKVKIKATSNSAANKYIESVTINGKSYDKSFIPHSVISDGAEIVFNMSSRPSDTFGVSSENRPVLSINETFTPVEDKWVFPPYVDTDRHAFMESEDVVLRCFSDKVTIKYTLNNSTPDENSLTYTEPIIIRKDTRIRAKAFKNGFLPSDEFNKEYYKAIFISGDNPYFIMNDQTYPKLELSDPPANQYDGGNNHALLDGIIGSTSFRDRKWIGLQGKNLIATVDLGKITEIKSLNIRFLRDHSPWIFYPTKVSFCSSDDGVQFKLLNEQEIIDTVEYGGPEIRKVSYNQSLNTRYIRIKASSILKCPSWHTAEGHDAWIFADEIIIVPFSN